MRFHASPLNFRTTAVLFTSFCVSESRRPTSVLFRPSPEIEFRFLDLVGTTEAHLARGLRSWPGRASPPCRRTVVHAGSVRWWRQNLEVETQHLLGPGVANKTSIAAPCVTWQTPIATSLISDFALYQKVQESISQFYLDQIVSRNDRDMYCWSDVLWNLSNSKANRLIY